LKPDCKGDCPHCQGFALLPCEGESYGKAFRPVARQLKCYEEREVLISSYSVHATGFSFHQPGHVLFHQHGFHVEDEFRGLQALELAVTRTAESQQMAKLQYRRVKLFPVLIMSCGLTSRLTHGGGSCNWHAQIIYLVPVPCHCLCLAAKVELNTCERLPGGSEEPTKRGSGSTKMPGGCALHPFFALSRSLSACGRNFLDNAQAFPPSPPVSFSRTLSAEQDSAQGFFDKRYVPCYYKRILWSHTCIGVQTRRGEAGG
jgi:hypothetical protein